MVIWYIFPRFGMLHREKSGSPECGQFVFRHFFFRHFGLRQNDAVPLLQFVLVRRRLDDVGVKVFGRERLDLVLLGSI
jgi:hypothetical protein